MALDDGIKKILTETVQKTIRETLTAAAELADSVTPAEVLLLQGALHAEGKSLAELAKVDRATVAAIQLRNAATRVGK